jgi:DNA repair protein SbcC/Rad50
MRLRHLRVRNIRSYLSGAIDFADGTTLISGDVGAGKTSLLYAVEMALFGTSEVDAAYLVRHGAGHAEVDVVFEDAEHRYEIGRRFRRVRRKGRETFEPEAISFSVDGAKTEYSATELRQRVIELLGFADNPNPQAHSDLWRWAVYVPQERMREILAARPQDRLETVRKALGVEQYRVGAENAQDLAADLRRLAVGRRTEADRLRHHDDEFASWTAESDRRRAERAALESEIVRRSESLATSKEALASAEAAVRRTEDDRRELERASEEHRADLASVAQRDRVREQRSGEIARLRVEIERADEGARPVDSLRRAVQELDEEVGRQRTIEASNAAAVRRLATARADLAGAAREVAEARELLARAAREVVDATASLGDRNRSGPLREPPAPTPDELEAIDARLERARARERETLAAQTRAEAALVDFEELLRVGVCPRCHQSVRSTEFEPHRNEAAAAAESARAAHAESVRDRERIEEARRARERFERARDRWREAERERESARSVLSRAEEGRRSAEEALARAGRLRADAAARVAA